MKLFLFLMAASMAIPAAPAVAQTKPIVIIADQQPTCGGRFANTAWNEAVRVAYKADAAERKLAKTEGRKPREVVILYPSDLPTLGQYGGEGRVQPGARVTISSC